jgi:hypothetical protein
MKYILNSRFRPDRRSGRSEPSRGLPFKFRGYSDLWVKPGFLGHNAILLLNPRGAARAVVLALVERPPGSSATYCIQVEDLVPCDDGGSMLLVRRTKSDPYGTGRLAYASPDTTFCVRAWLSAARIESGPILRGLRTGRVRDGALYPASVNTIVKSLAAAAGLPASTITGLSGHSARVGAAQDLACGGADLIAIMTAGRWKSVATVARYIEEAQVRRVRLVRLHAPLAPATSRS